MALDFPTSPALNDTYTDSGKTWKWNGSGWQIVAVTSLTNSDISPSAAIAGTKISPDFGSQNTTTTGTSTAASFIPTSSTVPTNGVYLPAANSVALATNGTGRLFVDSNGGFGVGTSTFNSYGPRLEVRGNTAGGADTYGWLVVSRGDASPSPGQWISSIAFADTEAYVAYIAAANDKSTWSSTSKPTGLVFHTSADGSFAPTERLRITSDGKLGVGTSAPGTLLDVVGGVGRIRTGGKAGSNTYLKLESTDASNSMELQFSNSTNANWYIQSVENGVSYRPLALNPAGGNVGIGTTSPGSPLEVCGSAASKIASLNDGTVGLNFTTTASGTNIEGWNFDNYIGLKTYSTGAITFDTNATERARIDSSGRLLVGTSSAFGSEKFRVNGLAVIDGTVSSRQATSGYTTGQTVSVTAPSTNEGSLYLVSVTATYSSASQTSAMGIAHFAVGFAEYRSILSPTGFTVTASGSTVSATNTGAACTLRISILRVGGDF